MAPLFLSNCPRNLTAWSCCGKTRDTMQVFTVAKMINDSSLPGGSFGTVAPSCTDRKNIYSWYAALALCIMRNEKIMESCVNFKLGATERETGARVTCWSKSYLTQVIFFRKKKNLFNWKSIASKSREHESPTTACQSIRTEHTLSKAVSGTIAQHRAKPTHLESQWLWSVTQLAGFGYQLISMVSGTRCEFWRPSSLALLCQVVTPEQPKEKILAVFCVLNPAANGGWERAAACPWHTSWFFKAGRNAGHWLQLRASSWVLENLSSLPLFLVLQ